MIGRRVRLLDGRAVWVRPIRPGDAEALRTFDAGLCDRSRRLRYLGWTSPLSAEQAQRLVNLGGCRRFAIVAAAACPGGLRLVADCRLVPVDYRPDSAEVAIAVADDFQDAGLGTAMISLVLGIAAGHDVAEVVARVHYDNDRMMHILRRLGFRRRGWDLGVVTFTLAPVSAAALPEAGPSTLPRPRSSS